MSQLTSTSSIQNPNASSAKVQAKKRNRVSTKRNCSEALSDSVSPVPHPHNSPLDYNDDASSKSSPSPAVTRKRRRVSVLSPDHHHISAPMHPTTIMSNKTMTHLQYLLSSLHHLKNSAVFPFRAWIHWTCSLKMLNPTFFIKKLSQLSRYRTVSPILLCSNVYV